MRYWFIGLIFWTLSFPSLFAQELPVRTKHDMDGDGKADILWRNQSTGQVWLWTMNGQLTSESKSIGTVSLDWEIVGRGDFNNDGKSDIIWRHSTSGRNYIWLMDGFNSIQRQEIISVADTDWQVKAVNDFNGDGFADIFWRHSETGRTYIWLMNGFNSIERQESYQVNDTDWQVVASGDVNGDGKSDIIWRHDTSGGNYIWQMDGTSVLSRYQLNTVSNAWKIAGVGDLDGDGTEDIIWRNENNGLNWAYLMVNGHISQSKQINTVSNSHWKMQTIADLDGDGKVDIFWRNKSTGQTYIYLMNGLAIKTADYSQTISSAWQVLNPNTTYSEEFIVTGQLTFERFGFKPSTTTIGNVVFDIDAPTILPARNVVVELVNEQNLAVASTVTDDSGHYHLAYRVPNTNVQFKIKAIAQLELDQQINDGFKIVVTDQTTSDELVNQEVYAFLSSSFPYTSGEAVFNFHLNSGWNDSLASFDTSKSFAQPFAILDTIYKTATFFESGGVTFTDSLDTLYINWTQAADTTERDAGFYSGRENRIFLNGDITHVTSQDHANYAAIEEWNETTIAHEFTHFYQKKVIGRDDSNGGTHSLWKAADLRLSLSEGLANAIAWKVTNSWSDYRVPTNIVGEAGGDNYYEIADGNDGGCRSTSTSPNNVQVQRDCYNVSPFNEATNALFILSLIDENKASTRWTTNLADQIGIAGLHQALTNAVISNASISIYSLAAEIKALYPSLISEIDTLGDKLNTNFIDSWGTGQLAVDTFLINDVDLLPIHTYLPVHVEVEQNISEELCFNGGLFYGSLTRPGTVRFVKYKAVQDGMVLVRVPDTTDLAENTHGFDVYAYQSGDSAERSHLFPNGRLDEMEFMAYAGKDYRITVAGKRYHEYSPNYNYHINETICTSITIEQQ